MTFGNRLGWLAIAVVVIWAAWLSLRRVESGELFLLSLPIDPAPFEQEVADAVQAAQQSTVPAVAFLAVASMAILFSVRLGPIEAIDVLRLRCRQLFEGIPVLCLLFILACTADFLSTLHYFHEFGISDELHPGIKLITYAWGRSLGCLIAKSIQGFLGFIVCALIPKIARAVLFVAIVGYTVAAIWNMWAS